MNVYKNEASITLWGAVVSIIATVEPLEAFIGVEMMDKGVQVRFNCVMNDELRKIVVKKALGFDIAVEGIIRTCHTGTLYNEGVGIKTVHGVLDITDWWII